MLRNLFCGNYVRVLSKMTVVGPCGCCAKITEFSHVMSRVEEIASKFVGEAAMLNQMLRKKYGEDLGQEWEDKDSQKLEADGNYVQKLMVDTMRDSKDREESMKIHQDNMGKIAKMSPVRFRMNAL